MCCFCVLFVSFCLGAGAVLDNVVCAVRRMQDMRRRLEAEVMGLRTKLNEPSTPSQVKYMDLARKVCLALTAVMFVLSMNT